MPIYDDYVRANAEDAHYALADVEARLAERAVMGHPIAGTAPFHIACVRAFAGWWGAVLAAIDHEGLDPVEAVARTHMAVLRILIGDRAPTCGRVGTIDQGAAVVAAREFYRATLHVEQIICDAAHQGDQPATAPTRSDPAQPARPHPRPDTRPGADTGPGSAAGTCAR